MSCIQRQDSNNNVTVGLLQAQQSVRSSKSIRHTDFQKSTTILLVSDYISNPKSNGYKPLHTKTIGPDGKILEIQFCTKQIHQFKMAQGINMSSKLKDFKWKHFQANIILWAVRWYSRFAISYRDLVIMAQERGLSTTHTTLMRWVHEHAPKLERKIKLHLKNSNDFYRVGETYIKIKGSWQCLYKAVDSDGNTLDWVLSRYRNQKAAKRFFKKLIGNRHCKNPRVINVDKAKTFPPAFAECQSESIIPINTKLRQQKYLNNIQEQDHRFTKPRVRYSQWFQSFDTARKTIADYETMHMICKRQVKNLAKGNIIAEIQFINNLFGVAA